MAIWISSAPGFSVWAVSATSVAKLWPKVAETAT